VVAIAAQSHTDLDRLTEAVEEHRAWLEESGALRQRRIRRAREEVEAIAVAALRSRWEPQGGGRLDELAAAVVAGESDPYAAADVLLG
jgi:LAO/AO transport system kinase